MPFTLSHAVLAPPIAKLSGGRLPIGALAIGCMVPDLYRLLVKKEILLNHQWHGIFHPDLWVGLLFCFLWYGLYRPMIFQAIGISNPLKLHSLTAILKFFIRLVIAVLIGTATHIIWDGLTHVDFRTFAFKDFLSQNLTLFHHQYPVHRILQIGSSIVVLPILLFMCLQYYRQHQQHQPISPKIKRFAVALLLTSFAVGCFSAWDYARYFSTEIWQTDLYFFVGKSINEFTQGALSVFTLSSLLFLFFDRDHRLG